MHVQARCRKVGAASSNKNPEGERHEYLSCRGRASGEWPIHGFVELWFRDRAAIIEAASSSVTRDLIVDELFFLDGLTGLDVGHSSLYNVSPHKIFIVGREVDARAGEDLLEELSPLPGFVLAQVDRVAGTMRRDALWSDPEPPTFVAFASFATHEESRSAYERIVEQESRVGQQREIYLTEELRIV
mgnify:CR=1 FL=1